MKLKRIFALALCSALSVGLVTLSASADSNTDDLHMSKSAVYDATTNSVQVTLEAYASGKVTSETKPKPTDFILVLDRSNSMSKPYVEDPVGESKLVENKPVGYYCAVDSKNNYYEVQWNETWQINVNNKWENLPYTYSVGFGPWAEGVTVTAEQIYVTKLGAMKDAANSFVDSVAQKATEDGVDHKIAVVSYAGSANVDYNLVDVRDNASKLKNAINVLSVAGETAGTKMDGGLSAANGIFTSANEKRTQVVITLTDGVPSETDGSGNEFNVKYANDAIVQANDLKAKGVIMYSIGIFDGAKPEQLHGDKWDYLFYSDISCNGNVGEYWGGSDAAQIIKTLFGNGFPAIDIPAGNRLLNYISNNYSADEIGLERGEYDPGKKDYSGTGYKITKNATASGQDYYMVADNLSALNKVFTEITSSVTSTTITLDGTSVLKDTYSEYFTLDEGSVTAQIVSNKDSSTTSLDPTISGSTISVSGFNYSATENLVTGANTGKKLVVTYTLNVKSGFLGGNGVPVGEGGIFDSGGAEFKTFDDVSVNVDIPDLKLSTLTDKNIYLLGTVSSDDMLDGVTATGNDAVIDLDNPDNYGLADWQNEFVDITVFATTTCTGTSDATYTVSCTVKPQNDGTAEEKSASGNANINVFKPVLTYTDYTVYLGGNVPDFEPQSTVWKHGDTKSTGVTMIGDEPELGGYTYSQSEDFTKCTDVTLEKVYIGGTDVQGYVTVTNEDEKFTVHVLKPTLSAEDTTIYYGKEINLNNCVRISNWGCKDGKTEKDTGLSAPTDSYVFTIRDGIPVSPSSSYSPDDCVKVTATLKINGTAYVGGLDGNGDEYTADFWVHVAKPSFTTTPVTIYRGNDTDLTKRVEVTEWKCKGSVGHSAQTLDGTGAPKITYSFNDDADVTNAAKYSPADCKSLTVTATVGNKTWTGNINNFTVHVLQPVFTVTTQDVWADYGTSVDLATNCIVEDADALTWADNTHNGITTTGATGAEPSVKTKSFEFKNGSASQDSSYTVGENDVTFTVSGTYTLSNDTEGITEFDTVITKNDFTVHVNKFKLTITRGWNDGDPTCYQQDAIFTVTQGRESFQVVIPKEQPSVTIGGLICGKDYTVTADSGWSWRWTSTVTYEETVKHTHNISNTEPAAHTKTVKVQNTLNDKTLWLSGDWWCQNTCTGNSITKIDRDTKNKKIK